MRLSSKCGASTDYRCAHLDADAWQNVVDGYTGIIRALPFDTRRVEIGVCSGMAIPPLRRRGILRGDRTFGHRPTLRYDGRPFQAP